jgi:protein phosphatase
VSSDRCRALVADDEGALWASGRAFEVFYLIIKHRLEVDRFTVADSTALERRARMDLLRIARHAGRPAYLLMFDVSAKTCLKRDKSRKRRVGADVIARHRRMMDNALKSAPTEGFDGVIVLSETEMDRVKIRRK